VERSKIARLIGALVLSVSIGKSYADIGLVGDPVSVSRHIPSAGYTFGPIDYVVQAGPADTVALTGGNNLYLNVENSSLLFSFGPIQGAGGPYPPMGHFISFQDLSSSAPTIVGISYNTDLSGFTASDISFTANSVTVGYGGISYSGGQYLTIDLQFAPEPSVFALMCFSAVLFMIYYIWRISLVSHL